MQKKLTENNFSIFFQKRIKYKPLFFFDLIKFLRFLQSLKIIIPVIMLKILFVAFLSVTFSSAVFSQNSNIATTIEIDVIKIYEQVVEGGYESAQIYQKLAQENFAKKNFLDSKKWFEKWFTLDEKPEPIAYLQYSKTLEILNQKQKAKEYLALYKKLTD